MIHLYLCSTVELINQFDMEINTGFEPVTLSSLIIVLYVSYLVCQEGFKPSISRTTIWRFNQLSY